MFINKLYRVVLKHCNGSKTYVEYTSDASDIYKNIVEHNPNKKRKILILFDDMILDMLCNENLQPLVTEFRVGIRATKLIRKNFLV